MATIGNLQKFILKDVIEQLGLCTAAIASTRNINTPELGPNMVWFYAVLLSTLLPHVVRGVCDDGWIHNGLYCYYFSTYNATFEDADAFCLQSEALLVDINDRAENDFVVSFSADNSHWLGYKLVFPGIWRWQATGSVGQYSQWDLSEPDGEGDCARITPFSDGVWRDYPCNLNLRFVCKKLADCGEPFIMNHASIDFSSAAMSSLSNKTIFASGTKASYTCRQGYEYQDGSLQRSSTCELGGVWRPNLVEEDSCIPQMCPPPATYNYVNMNASADENYAFGTRVVYRCNEGYWFSLLEAQVKEKAVTCLDSKEWAGANISHCSLMDCSRPITGNSFANSSRNSIGTAVMYRCKTGYTFSNRTTTKVFTCGKTTWEPPAEQCVIKKCPYHSVTGAIPSTYERGYDTEVKWRCESGKQYPDTATAKAMRCKENEEWDYVINMACQGEVITNTNVLNIDKLCSAI